MPWIWRLQEKLFITKALLPLVTCLLFFCSDSQSKKVKLCGTRLTIRDPEQRTSLEAHITGNDNRGRFCRKASFGCSFCEPRDSNHWHSKMRLAQLSLCGDTALCVSRVDWQLPCSVVSTLQVCRESPSTRSQTWELYALFRVLNYTTSPCWTSRQCCVFNN